MHATCWEQMATLKLVFRLTITYVCLSASSGDTHLLHEVPAYSWEDWIGPEPRSLALLKAQGYPCHSRPDFSAS